MCPCSWRCCLHCITVFMIGSAILLQFALDDTESDDDNYCAKLTSNDVEEYQHLFTLSDGRTLEYFHFGDVHSENFLLTLHGVMTEGSISYRNHQLFKDLNLNVISPSIPGCGQSSSSKKISKSNTGGHSIINDAKDFIQLMDYLQIKQFMLAGWSAGAQYALGVASLDPNRISKLGLFVPVSMYYGKCTPFATEIETNIRYFMGTPYIRHIMSMMTANLISNEFLGEYIKPNDMKAMVWNSLKRSFCKSRNGLTIMSEYVISDWSDIDFDKVSKIGKVIISSNLNDTLNIPSMQKCLDSLIDGAVLIEFENKTHFDVMEQTQDLLNTLIKL